MTILIVVCVGAILNPQQFVMRGLCLPELGLATDAGNVWVDAQSETPEGRFHFLL